MLPTVNPFPARALAPPPSKADELQRMQTLIARRADELSSAGPKGHNHDLKYWLQAEEELFAEAFGSHSRQAYLIACNGNEKR
jgi:hypothetical protein